MHINAELFFPQEKEILIPTYTSPNNILGWTKYPTAVTMSSTSQNEKLWKNSTGSIAEWLSAIKYRELHVISFSNNAIKVSNTDLNLKCITDA